MALRSRVPRRKQLGEGKRSRNKNPKLSPFQREMKRDRLANQAPDVSTVTPAAVSRRANGPVLRLAGGGRLNADDTESTLREDFPKSARGLLNTLMRRRDKHVLHERRRKESEENRADKARDPTTTIEGASEAEPPPQTDATPLMNAGPMERRLQPIAHVKQTPVGHAAAVERPTSRTWHAGAAGSLAAPVVSPRGLKPPKDFKQIVDPVGFLERAHAPPTAVPPPKPSAYLDRHAARAVEQAKRNARRGPVYDEYSLL